MPGTRKIAVSNQNPDAGYDRLFVPGERMVREKEDRLPTATASVSD